VSAGTAKSFPKKDHQKTPQLRTKKSTKTTPQTKKRQRKKPTNPPSQNQKTQTNKTPRPGLVAKAAFPTTCTSARMREMGWDRRKL